MPDNIFSLPSTLASLSPLTAFLNILAAFALSFLIAFVYRATHRGLSYSQNFTVSLILIGFLIASIVMVIGSSIALAFAAFGAISLVRFRTAIKDTKDIAFVLMVVAVGFASGASNYAVAGITAVFGIIAVFVLHKMNFGSIRKYDYVFNFTAESALYDAGRLRDIFAEFLTYNNLLNAVVRENGRVMDYSYNVKFISSQDIEKFAKRVGELPGVSDVDIISAKNDIEY